MKTPGERLAPEPGQPLGAQHGERRNGGQSHGEKDDRPARPTARDKELRVVPEKVQERRQHGERPQGGEMDAALDERDLSAPRLPITTLINRTLAGRIAGQARRIPASDSNAVRHTAGICALSAWLPLRLWLVARAACVPGLRPSALRGCRPSG